MRMGVAVQNLSQVGCGCPDICVSLCGQWHLIEIKCGPDWKLRDSQIKFQKRHNAPVHVFENEEQVVEWVNRVRRVQRTDWHQA